MATSTVAQYSISCKFYKERSQESRKERSQELTERTFALFAPRHQCWHKLLQSNLYDLAGRVTDHSKNEPRNFVQSEVQLLLCLSRPVSSSSYLNSFFNAFGVLSAAILEELVEELKSGQQILLLQEVLDHRRSTVRVQVLLLILFRMD
eukprot:SM000044S16018  [mRNA]  locus=s44:569774:575527:- [translate_table: standard]